VGLNILNRIGKVIDHNISKFIELVLETRKDFNQKVLLYNSSGEDSPPIKEERIIILPIDGTGKYIAVGVLTESQGAKPGEKIFFARDQEGNIVAKISMLNDGSVSMDTDTETTDEASGNYKRAIKGTTAILEKNDRDYINEKNVNETIKENKSMLIEGDETREVSGDKTDTIGGDENRGIDGNKTENIGGDFEESVTGNKKMSIGGNLDIEVSGNVTINGATINLN
jgi:hypothetical protein